MTPESRIGLDDQRRGRHSAAMSTSTKTVAERFQGYTNEVYDRTVAALAADGLDSPLGEWLTTDPSMQILLADALAALGNDMLRAVGDQERADASDIFTSRLHNWIGSYVAAWSD